eukprot:TRINITY_DN5496_c0_g2_i1.p1 TRINITY_DN5496_c0_g2~~TRINITY_DN5496_c0_g2_i1.p1  ORF type:complete len:333 (-),score=57.46 TRINITY_DN5496_c0_g2_i1:23-1000(-)
MVNAVNKRAPARSESLDWEIDPNDLEISDILGSGAFGSVYKGMLSDSPVAIKVLDHGTITTVDFKKEFEVLIALKSEYVVRFFGACVREKLCLVMEFCSRGSLYDVLLDEELEIDWERGFHFAISLVKAVYYLHSHKPQVLHRDLKSRNFLVNNDFEVRVCDFGLSRFNTESSVVTLAKCKGTFVYTAPELMKENQVFTSKSDIYSLGLILWEVFFRVLKAKYERPFAEYPHYNLDFQILYQASHCNLRPSFPEQTPKSLVSLVQSAWSPNPVDRPDISALLSLLDKCHKEFSANASDWASRIIPSESSSDSDVSSSGSESSTSS